MNKRYLCKNCYLQGLLSELEYDRVDTCFGDYEIEMCPNSGSYEVKSDDQ